MKNLMRFCLSSFFLPVLLTFVLCQSAFAEQKISVSFDLENHALSGVSSFDLAPEMDLALHTDGIDVTGIAINELAEPATIEDGLLLIAASPERRTVQVYFTKKYDPEFVSGSFINGQGIVLLDPWYPIPGEDTLVSLTAEIPANFYAVSEADEIFYRDSSGGKKVSFDFPHATGFVHFVAGPYQVQEEKLPGGIVLSTYFFPEDSEFAQLYASKTKQYLQRYQELIGPYPYKRFSVVENRLPTGFAMPTFTLLGSSVVRLPFIVETSLGHEVLHSWFGNSVGVDYEQGNWCEGLTTYLADQAFAADRGEGAVFRKGQFVKYHSHVGLENDMTVADFKSPGDHSPAHQASRAVGYNKASMIFHMLRKKLGDEIFFAALRTFYTDNIFKTAGWSDLRIAFEGESGEDLQNFFDQWLNRADLPEIAASHIKLDIEDGEPVLRFDLVQKNDPPYQLNVTLLVESGKQVVEKEVALSSPKTEVSIPLASVDYRMTLDPDYDLMRSLSPDELPSVWSRFQGSSAKVAVLEKGKEEVYNPFLSILAAMDCPVVAEEELDGQELSEKDVLFLGSESMTSRGIFGRSSLPATGFTVDVRKNPLADGRVAVLAQAEDRDQAAAAVHKLRHYGKYGYLHFQEGKIQEKAIPESDFGQIYIVDDSPRGAAVGKSLDFAEIMDKVSFSRVIYVGETHVDQADHLLQYRVLKALHEKHGELAIGMEMFNRSSQPALDSYIAGEIDERQFLKDSNYFKNWGYDYRFYRDILQFARRHSLPVIALNLDKDIVSKTFKNGGIFALPEEIQQNLPQDRDLSMPGYRDRLAQVFGSHSGPYFDNGNVGHFLQAQALWDETMAETIASYLRGNAGKKMVVIAGSGHVVKENAIPPRVSGRLSVSQSVLMNVRQNELAPDEADYVFFSAPVKEPPSPKLGVMLAEKEEGLVISGLSPHGGAKKAKLAEKDVILAIDGEVVKTVEDIKISLLNKEHGDTVRVKVRRPVFLLPDAEIDVDVQL